MEELIAAARKTVQNALPKNKKEMENIVKFRHPADILKNHESYLYLEILLFFLAFLTFCHAMKYGGRYRWMWFASLGHGLTVEFVSYFVPDIDNFWHAQSMIMFAGQRLPLHIILFYPLIIYTSCVAVAHLNLRWWAEPCAVGLSAVLLDVPFDILGIKNLWWTWHDDDPNIFDRHYWVPWTSYYFHASFASSFAFLFFGVRKLLCRPGLKFESCGFFGELPILILTSLFSMPLGVLQFVPMYHYLHDSLGIHSEVCTLLYLATFAVIVWSADRIPYESARQSATRVGAISLIVLLHYSFYIYIVFTAKPQNIKSVGLHQQIGRCDVPVKVLTPFGQVLKKSKYLCIDNYHEDIFDFKCVKKPPQANAEWYTVCGTPYENHAEYILVVCTFCALGLLWFLQLLHRSGPQPRTQRAPRKQHRD